MGELATYETVTGYRVTPIVGWVEPPFTLSPDPVEVAEAFEVPLAFVLDPANQQRQFRMLGELRRDFCGDPLARSRPRREQPAIAADPGPHAACGLTVIAHG